MFLLLHIFHEFAKAYGGGLAGVGASGVLFLDVPFKRRPSTRVHQASHLNYCPDLRQH